MPRPRNEEQDVEAPESQNFFLNIPALIGEKGRAKGFEAIRDLVLEHFGGKSPFAALKMAMETDRHALFAELSEAKTKGNELDKRWQEYQEYLTKGVQDDGKIDAKVTKRGKKNGKSVGQGSGTNPDGGQVQSSEGSDRRLDSGSEA